MIGPEKYYLRRESFIDVATAIDDEQALLLYKDRVEVIEEGAVVEMVPVHYRGIDKLARQNNVSVTYGELVTDDFKKAAASLNADYDPAERDAKHWKNYPVLTIINNLTNESVSEVLDVAALILKGELPLYSVEENGASNANKTAVPGLDALNTIIAGQDAGNTSSLPRQQLVVPGLDHLVREMAKDVQVDEAKLIAMIDETAYPISAIWESRIGLTSFAKNTKADSERDIFDLAEIQFTLAQSFANDKHRVEENYNMIEHVIRVAEMPKLDRILPSLVKKLGRVGEYLMFMNQPAWEGEPVMPSFMRVDSQLKLIGDLSAEDTLDFAVLNAYQAYRIETGEHNPNQ